VPPDAEPHEGRWFAVFGLLELAAPPAALHRRLCEALEEAQGRRAPSLRWLAPISVAAALLVAFGLLGFSRAAADAAREATASLDRPLPALREVAVIDDPSVPLFHDMETFGALDPASGPAGGDAPGGR
jgi:hypothetical protein